MSANNVHNINTPPTIVYRVDPRGQIRGQRYSPGVRTPDHGWPTLESLYAAEDFGDGWTVFLTFLDAVANGMEAELPDEWLPKSVLALREEDGKPKKWTAPPRKS